MDKQSQTPPLITVLMPIYNSPDPIASVDSVLRQDYGSIEFLLIDDHSQNFPCADISAYLRAHAGSNIQSWKVIENSQNLGTVKTLNKGLKYSQGEIIFNLAGDDLFADERVLSDWVQAFHDTHAAVMLGIRENYDGGFSSCVGITPDRRQAGWLRTLSPQQLFEKIAVDNFLSGCSMAHTRGYFEKYGLYDERYRLIEDFPAALRFLRDNGRVAFFDRKVIRYRGGGISAMGGIGADYERDIRLIYENEIIPYTKYPGRAKRRLRRWEKSVAFDRRYVRLKKQYSLPVLQAALEVWYDLYHPHQWVKKVFNRVSK